MTPNTYLEGDLVAVRMFERRREANHNQLVRSVRHATRWTRRSRRL